MLELAKVPPTDNLYKFLALSGLAILLFSFVWPELRTNEITAQGLELQKEIRSWLTEVEDEVVKLKVMTKEEIGEIEKKRADKPGVSLEEYIANWTERVNEIDQGLIKTEGPEARKLRTKAIEIKYLLERLSYRLHRLHFYRDVFTYGIWSGLGFTALGFALWYGKLQRFQDRMIAKQSTE